MNVHSIALGPRRHQPDQHHAERRGETQNILYSSSATPHLYDWIDGHSPAISQNLYFNTTGVSMRTAPPTLDASPAFGDPKFTAPAAGDYSLGAGSATAAVGFKAIDQSASGRHPATAQGYTWP